MTKENSSKNQNEKERYEPLNLSNSLSVYNERELSYLDKFLPIVHNAFDEDELYQIIMDCEFNDKEIERTINEKQRYMKFKGTQYGWNVVDSNRRVRPVEANEHLKKETEVKDGKKDNINKQKGKKYQKEYKNNNFKNKDNTGHIQKEYNYEDKYFAKNFDGNYYQNNQNYSEYESEYPQYNNSYVNKANKAYYNQSYTSYDNSYPKNYKKNNNFVDYPQETTYSNYNDEDTYTYNTNNKKDWNADEKVHTYYYKDYNSYKNYGDYKNKDYQYGSSYNNKYYDNAEYNSSYNTQYAYDNNYYANKNSNYGKKYNKKTRPNTSYDKNNFGNSVTFVEFKEYVHEPNLQQNKITEKPSEEKTTTTTTETKRVEEVKIENEVKKESNNLAVEPESSQSVPKSNYNVKDKIDIEIEKEKRDQKILISSLNESSNLLSKQADISSPAIVDEEIEEINVNKTNIENLRSYFDRLKQKTIFNENIQENGNVGSNYNSGIYEKFSNFTGMNLPVFQTSSQNQNETQGNNNEDISRSNISKDSTNTTSTNNNMSKLLNNLSINNNQFLEITSSGNKMESENDGKKIVNFSLFFSGTDNSSKKQKTQDVPIEGQNKSILNNTQIPLTSNNMMMPNPYGNYPPQYEYMNYQNQQRYSPYMGTPEAQPYTPEGVNNEMYNPNLQNMQGMYDYSQYPYYQMPYRMNPMQFPYQNANYQQYQENRVPYQAPGIVNPQEAYQSYLYPTNPQNMNMNYYQPQGYNPNSYNIKK